MNKLVIPGIYRHFKHDDKADNKLNYMYVTIGKSTPKQLCDILQREYIYSDKVLRVKLTESDEYITIYEVNGQLFHNANVYNHELVIYKALYDNYGIYARPMTMFLDDGAIGRPENKTGQTHRMELVGGIYNVSGAVEGH